MTPIPADCPLVFDLDGTLVDSAPDIHACVNAVLRQYQFAPLTLLQVRKFIGGGVDVLWDKIIHALQIPREAKQDLIASFMARYHDATALTRMFSGVQEALGALAAMGHPLGLCTNKPMGPTLSVLDHFGLRTMFASIVAGDSTAVKKPHPTPLRLAFEQLGADPISPAGLYIGDSEFDAECAAAVPLPFLIFTSGYRQTPLNRLIWTRSFDDFTALPALVSELCGSASQAGCA